MTHHILYNEFKAQHYFTDIINACVSHELRNPLNSILATNIEKRALYAQLRAIIEDQKNFQEPKEFQNCCLQILDKLDDALTMQ